MLVFLCQPVKPCVQILSEPDRALWAWPYRIRCARSPAHIKPAIGRGRLSIHTSRPAASRRLTHPAPRVVCSIASILLPIQRITGTAMLLPSALYRGPPDASLPTVGPVWGELWGGHYPALLGSAPLFGGNLSSASCVIFSNCTKLSPLSLLNPLCTSSRAIMAKISSLLFAASSSSRSP